MVPKIKEGLDLLDLLENWIASDRDSHLSIIGEFGQGKSTALLAHCADWARRWISGDKNGRVPLLIELRGKSPKRQSPEAFLSEWGQRFRLHGDALLNLIKTGRAILIFEGFDEIQDAGMRYDRFQQFKALWDFSYPGTKIIFTGRPNFFLDSVEMVNLLRDSPVARAAGLVGSEIYQLRFLEGDSIANALRRHDSETVAEIVARCSEDKAFLDIVRRPSMLPLIASLWPSIRAEIRAKNSVTSAQIIKQFIDYLYKRKEADAERLGRYHVLSSAVRHYVTQRVAWKMAETNSRNTITAEDFAEVVERACDSFDTEFRSGDADDGGNADFIRDLKAKYESRPRHVFIADVVTDVRAQGLLTPDPAGGRNNLYFPHKQYYEYILGEVFWTSQNGKKDSWASGLTQESLMRIVRLEPSALLFSAGLWDEDKLRASRYRRTIGERLKKSIQARAVYIDAVEGVLFEKIKKILSVFSKYNFKKNDTNNEDRDNRRVVYLNSTLVMSIIKSCPIKYRYLFLKSRVISYNGEYYIMRGNRLLSINLMMATIFGVYSINILNLREVLDYYAFVIAATLAFTTFALISLTFSVRSRNIRMEDAYLIMEYLRFGEIRSIRKEYGERAHSSLLAVFGTPENLFLDPIFLAIQSSQDTRPEPSG
ncbi:hypothetical protein HNP52_002731 [Sphingomonas kyeonggiensis]|uniref:NACHT domain-containing protein n=1 Tax=Sphingomonas kyeonggiensis TaxID=1268553 RepID=A0A7W7K260_9SPHN|nr:hypothetical protein [Sphingomonas kyeonggiensis]MBB4839662.1 hypothetical protein [Sphingomonas kyeonggiensis]